VPLVAVAAGEIASVRQMERQVHDSISIHENAETENLFRGKRNIQPASPFLA
jgi:hypothetical protein